VWLLKQALENDCILAIQLFCGETQWQYFRDNSALFMMDSPHIFGAFVRGSKNKKCSVLRMMTDDNRLIFCCFLWEQKGTKMPGKYSLINQYYGRDESREAGGKVNCIEIGTRLWLY